MPYRIEKKVCFLLILVLFGACNRQGTNKPPPQGTESAPGLTVFLIRHAEANKNVKHPETFRGNLESLTPRGIEQANAVGRHLKKRDVVSVFTSPRESARQTAEAIAKTMGLRDKLFEKEELLPLRVGKQSNGKQVTWSWREQQWKSGRDPRPQGGESLQDGMDRATLTIEALAEGSSGKSVAIVTHSDICAALIGKAEKTPVAECYRKHKVPLGSISEIYVSFHSWALKGQGMIPEGTNSP